jgi:hypothetical protein
MSEELSKNRNKALSEGGYFEVRFYLTKEFAAAARAGEEIPGLAAALKQIGGSLECQLDEFQNFLFEKQKIGNWEQAYPDAAERKFQKEMEAFTLKTLLNDGKREYLAREFTVAVKGNKNFRDSEADAVIAVLQTLDGKGIYGKGPKQTDKGVRKVFFPPRHPGTSA